MKAKVTVAFPGLPDGELVVRNFNPGDEVTGDLAKVAVREKWALPIIDGGEPAPKATAAAPAPAKAGKGGKGKGKAEPEADPELEPDADHDGEGQ